MVGGVALIKVGAATETELKEKKARVGDAAATCTERPRSAKDSQWERPSGRPFFFAPACPIEPR